MAEIVDLKGTLDEQIKEEIMKLPKESKVRAVALNHNLNKKKELDTQLEKEIKAIEQKYEQLSQPLYQQSQQLISGSRLPNDEELANLEDFLNETEKALDKQSLIDTPENKQPIEGYWLQVLKNSDQLAHEIQPKDEEVLKSLLNVEFVGKDAANDFSITFTFANNEYFTNEKITKKFLHKEGEDEHYKTEVIDAINWKEGKNITMKQVKKKQKNNKSGQQRVITKEVEDESFFNFFKPSELKEDEKDQDEEEEQQLLEKMNQEADIAQTLIDEIIPYSLEYYLGIKVEEEGEDGDFQDEDDDIQEEDDEDQEDLPKKKSNKSKSGHKGSHKTSNDKEGGAGQDGQKNAECKQQ